MMTRAEFIAACTRGGYASKITATKYAGDGEIFAESDIVEAYRIEERKAALAGREMELMLRDMERDNAEEVDA